METIIHNKRFSLQGIPKNAMHPVETGLMVAVAVVVVVMTMLMTLRMSVKMDCMSSCCAHTFKAEKS